MRTFASLCSLGLLLASAARPALAEDLIVDDAAPAVQIKGTWAVASTTPGFIGNGYRYRVAGDGSSTLRWPLAATGTFDVFARWTSGANRASNATYLVTHAAGASPIGVDQRANGGVWQPLGTFSFSGGPDQGVTLSDKADGIVIADAIRFVPSSGAAPAAAAPTSAAAASDPRFFTPTGFRVERDAFWDFFVKRGGVRSFGYPISRELTLGGCQTQLFQRLAMQQCGGNGVGTLNVLDDGLLPASKFGASTVPTPDPAITAAAPLPSDPSYATSAIDFVRANAPDTFDGEPVHFFSTFEGSVSLSDAFPQGGGNPALLPLLNLQLWGLPTSKPAYDPNNHEFIYLRFQRGVMHYDRGCKCTQGLLVTDYFKDALKRSGSVSADAFAVQTPVAIAVAAPAPPAAPAPAPAGPITVSSPDYGMSAFLWGHPDTTGRDLKLVTDLGFRWQKTLFQWRQIEGGCKGCFDWSEADRVVKASAAAGVQIIARLDFQPTWSRKDGAANGPPDDYQDYADFVSAFVARYASQSSIGRVAAIEVWNEVNLDREWGGATIDKQQAADYVRLLGAAYAAAKAADPNVIVITAGLSPTGVSDGHAADDVQYLQWLFDAGLKGKYDVLGAHGNVQAPEVDAAFGSLPSFPHASFYFRRIEQLREVMVRNGDTDKRVWLLEFGWTADTIHPNYAWFAVSEDKKGTNILRALQYARQHWQPWIGVMTLWTLPDPTWTTDREEYWWAITNADGTPRPAYVDLLQARHDGVLS